MKGIIDKKFFDDRYEILCTVPDECIDLRLDLFIQIHFPSFTREFIKKKIEKGQVKILTRQGNPKPSSRLKSWDKVHIVCHREKIEDEYWDGQLIQFEDLNVLYNHESFCVVNKPPFMCAHPTGRHVFYCATVYAEKIMNTQCSTVHRLDRETSGILVLSKDSDYGNLLATQFEKHGVQKFYFFISKNNNEIKFPFVAQERLGHHPDPKNFSRIFMHTFPKDSEIGKSATTYFDVIAQCSGFLLGLAIPKTGRQHQIRSHAAHHGIPLIGDKIYFEGEDIFKRFKDGIMSKEDINKMILPRHALHAVALDFLHLNLPKKHFFAPLPNDIKHFIMNFTHLDIIEIEQVIEKKLLYWKNEKF